MIIYDLETKTYFNVADLKYIIMLVSIIVRLQTSVPWQLKTSISFQRYCLSEKNFGQRLV